MKILLEIPDNKSAFIMELIESFPYIKAKSIPDVDTTEYLLSSDVNSKRLMDAIERSKRNESEIHELLD